MRYVRSMVLVVLVAALVVFPLGCINVTSTTGLSLNPYVQWAAVNGVDLTPLVDELATQLAQLENLNPVE